MKRREIEDENDEDGGGLGLIQEDPLLARLSSRSVADATPLTLGQSVQAEQNGQWWQASVLQLLEDGRVLIHYTGWESSWDEAVPRSRLRAGGEAPRVVVRCDDGSIHDGRLVGSQDEFFILKSAEGEATLFVNRNKIVVIEVRLQDD